MFYLNPIFLSVKAELNCKITGMINFENDIDTNVKNLPLNVECAAKCKQKKL